jgi:hypothetical protein
MAVQPSNFAPAFFRRFTRNRQLLIAVRLVFTVISVNVIFTGCVIVTVTSIKHHRYHFHSSSQDGHTSVNESGYYVTLCADRIYGPHRTGNQLFLLAAALYVANRTGRKLTMPAGCRWPLDTVFQLDEIMDDELIPRRRGRHAVIERFQDSKPPPCPCRQLKPQEGTPFLHGDDMLDKEDGLRQLMTPSSLRNTIPATFTYVITQFSSFSQ